MTYLLFQIIRHPARVCSTRIDDVCRDSPVLEFLGSREDNTIHRPLADAIGQVVRSMIACDRNNTTTPMITLESSSKLPCQQPRSSSVNRKMQIKALNSRVFDIAFYRVTVCHHQGGDRTKGAFNMVKNTLRRSDV